MFSSSVPVPSSTDAQKLIDAIRDQTDGVPTHLVFVLDIVSVRFGGYFTPQIKAEIQRFPYLQMLTLNDCGIKSLQNFPHLPGLIRLDLVFNQIAGESLNSIRGSRHLQTLMLGANKIQKFEHLEQLSNLKQLLQLDLINNPVSKLSGYREKMFSIFPTITILDTLDRSGKDAYTNSSMALTVSRVPDALFDKSAPVPAPALSTFATSSVPVRTKSISRPAATTSAVIPSPLVATSSRSSVKPKTVSKPATMLSSKRGKAGKAGKAAIIKSRSASSRAGLVFPVGRLKRKIKQSMTGVRVSKNAAIYMASVLEYLTAQLVEGAGNVVKNEKKRRISPADIKNCLKLDTELNSLLKGITLSMN